MISSKINIIDTFNNRWIPGKYEIKLDVFDDSGKLYSIIQYLTIILVYGDEYPNSYIVEQSTWIADGNNAVGPEDGKYSRITSDYSNGYITLDMGILEEITDGIGDDFEEIATGGVYSVYASGP